MSVEQIPLWFPGQASVGLLKPYEVENLKLSVRKTRKQSTLFLSYHVVKKLRIGHFILVSVSKTVKW